MNKEALENLAKIGQLKSEPRSALDIERLLAMAHKHLADANRESNSLEGRFISAYSVGHAASLAALRWHGYRSENRYQVFQCLPHTLGWTAVQWRQLDIAHNKRNLAEYEGYLEIEPSYLQGLIALVTELLGDAERLIHKKL
ncbi:MAG: hypothetical protein HC858_00770 [Brachymonas sp.]|nr:hypothetical protein [Brachymonas sp.]